MEIKPIHQRLQVMQVALQRHWWQLGFCVVGVALFVDYSYPGFMSYDSAWQLREARSGWYTDWHPPAMAAIWRMTEHIVKGPFGMLTLQVSAFLGGTYLILRRFASAAISAVLATALLLLPPIATSVAVVWKDCQMVGFLLLGTGLVLSNRRCLRMLGLIAFCVASAMRHNAFTMTFPLILMCFKWATTEARWRRWLKALLLWIGITTCAFLVNQNLTDEQKHPWQGSLAIFDIVGTIRFSTDQSDMAILKSLTGVPLEQSSDLQRRFHDAYNPVLGIFKIMDDKLIRQPIGDDERNAIAKAWWVVISGHPKAYLWHRWRAFEQLLGLAPWHPENVWTGIDDSGKDMVLYSPNRLQKTLFPAAHWLGTSVLMRPYLYLIPFIFIVPWAIRRRQTFLIGISASALASEAALYFLSPTPDFRYSLWLAVCAVLGAIVMSLQLYELRRPKELQPHVGSAEQ